MQGLLKLLRFILKGLFVAGGLFLSSIGLSAFAGLGLGIAGAVLVGKVWDRVSSLRSNGERVTLENIVGRQTMLRLNGWNLREVPVDMKFRALDGRHAVIGAAGIDDLIKANKAFLASKADYVFPVKDFSSAQRVHDYIGRNRVDAQVVPDGSGGYSVVCHEIQLANALAKEAYPSHKADVEREVVHGRQFVVTGAANYEDAVALLKAKPDAYKCVNSYGSVRFTVDGEAREPVETGTKLGVDYFGPDGARVGTYVVNVEDIVRTKGKLSVPFGMDDTAFGSLLESSVSENSADFRSVKSDNYLDGTPEGIPRYFIADGTGRRVELRNPDAPLVVEEDRLKAYVMANSMDDLVSVLNEGRIPDGTYISVSQQEPVVGAGKFLLELNLADPALRRSIAGVGGVSADFYQALSELGVEAASVDYSRLLDRVRERGSVGTYLDKEIAGDMFLQDVKVLGIPARELQERLVSDRCIDLDEKQAAKWAKEAAQIHKIDVEIDLAHAEVRISSTVSDPSGSVSTKREVFPIKDVDLTGFARKGAIPEAEMKDLLMRLHPDYFSVYSNRNGNSIFKDPLGSFLRGEKPELVSKTAKLPNAQKQNQQTRQRQSNGRKPGLGVS